MFVCSTFLSEASDSSLSLNIDNITTPQKKK